MFGFINAFSVNQSDLQGAFLDCTAWIRDNPDDIRAYTCRAECARRQGRIKLALEDINVALKIDNTYEMARMIEAHILLDGSYLKAAASKICRIFDKMPCSRYANALAGHLALRQSRVEDALLHFDYVLYHKVDDYCLQGRVEAYLCVGRYRDALADLNTLIKYFPKSSFAYEKRGLILMDELNDTEAALKDFNRALELDPKSTIALGRRGYIRYLKEKTELALEDLNKCLECEPNNLYALEVRGEVFSDLKNYGEAMTDFNRVLSINPQSIFALEGRARNFFYSGCVLKAERDAETALGLQGNAPYALMIRGLCRFHREKLDCALLDLDRALSLDPKLPDMAINTRAEIYHRQGRIAEAIALIIPTKKNLDRPEFTKLKKLSEIYFQHGMWAQASKVRREASSLSLEEGKPPSLRFLCENEFFKEPNILFSRRKKVQNLYGLIPNLFLPFAASSCPEEEKSLL